MGAVLGQIDKEDLSVLKQVGEEARTAIFMSKKEIHVHISRCCKESESAGERHVLKGPLICSECGWSVLAAGTHLPRRRGKSPGT